MKLIWWNVDNALARLPALQTLVAELGSPEVLCLQELRIRGSDVEAIARWSKRCRDIAATARFCAIRATSRSGVAACRASRPSYRRKDKEKFQTGIVKGAWSSCVFPA